MRQRCSGTQLWICTLAVVLLLGGTMPAVAQLTDEDIARLRAEGEQQSWTFKIGHNAATGYNLDQLCGTVRPADWRERARFDPCHPTRDLPTAYDWRDYGACTAVRNQADCGSCWAFAVMGAFESNILMVDGVAANLSEQWLVSCTDSGSCSGGWPGDACDYLLCDGWTDPCGDRGATLESEFPYVADDGNCQCPYQHPYCLDDWAFIGPEWGTPSVGAIKQAIYDHGPVVVCVYVNDAFQAYNGDIFNACEDVWINHAIVLVGWDDSQGSDGVWLLRNSWSSGWGEDGYMRIEYECSRVGYNGLYVNFAGSPTVTFAYPEGRPVLAVPDEVTTFRVNISTDTGTLYPATAKLRYSINGGVQQSTWLTHLGDDGYEAYLPATACLNDIDWYLRIEEAQMGYHYDPPDAPVQTYRTFAALGTSTLFEDDFETDLGWTVYDGADVGNWERADPEQVLSGEVVSQPEDDHTPAGTLCYVTGAAGGGGATSYDVDGGPTHLTSPVFDLEGHDAIVSYWRWYHISTEWDDELVVSVSNDDGANWVTVETVVDREEWTHIEWVVSDYVTPTALVRVRFTAADSPDNSLVEALIDDFRIEIATCGGLLPGDMNCDGEIDFGDINPFVQALSDPSAYQAQYDCYDNGDVNDDGEVNFGDINPFVALLSG